MGIIALVLILIAPIGQIIWSNRRMNNKTQMPMGGIVVLMAALGVGLSIAAFYLLCSQIPPSNGHGVCVTVEASFMIMGGFIALVIIPVIGIIYGFVYYFKHPYSSDEEAAAKVNEVLKKHYK